MKFQIMAGASAAALLFAGAAYAQQGSQASYTPAVTQSSAADASSIDQIGDDNAATVTQGGGAQGYNDNREDSSVVIQGGQGFAGKARNNVATVNQTGYAQRALVMQATDTSTSEGADTSKAGTPGNTASVTQSVGGQNGFAYQFGSNNGATIAQSGYAVGQVYNPNNPQGVNGAADTQTGINAAVAQRKTSMSGAKAAIKTGALSQGFLQTANVVQDWATNNSASVTQSGTSLADSANITQAFQDHSTASVSQDGAGQAAWISQEGVSATGSNNDATIEQGAGAVQAVAVTGQFDALNSYSDTKQTGAQSTAYTYQSGMADYSTIAQNDVGSTATVTQTGGDDVSDVTQSGGAGVNTATVNQGLANAWSHVAQNGFSNTATVNQGTPSAFLAPKN